MVLVGTNKVWSTPSSLAAFSCSSEEGRDRRRRETPSAMALFLHYS